MVLQAIIGSILIHVSYIACMKLVGYFKTNAYKPDIVVAWDKVEILQNEVVFGKIISSNFALLSFVGKCSNNRTDYGGVEMTRFINDLAGAIYDFFKFIFTSICYLIAGMLIVGVPLYLIALVFNMLQ